MSLFYRVRIRNAADDADALTFTSLNSGSSAILSSFPTGDGQTLDMVEGSVSVGAYTVRVIDNGSTVSTVTAALADALGRQQLLSRKAYVEEGTDGSTWPTVLTAGYVNAIRLVNATEYEFTIGESKLIEHSVRVFDRISDPVAYPNGISVLDRASCIIGGPIIGTFGPTADRGRPLYRVASVTSTAAGNLVELRWESGFLYHGGFTEEASSNLADESLDFFNGIARGYLDENAKVDLGGFRSFAPLAGVVVRVYNDGNGLWVADHDAVMDQKEFAKGWTWRFITSEGTILARWTTAAPSVGEKLRLAVFPTETSPRNPMHVTGHPVDIYRALADSKGIAFDSTSADAVKAALGANMLVDLRVTQGEMFEEWVTKHLFGPFGFTVRANAAGEREFITTRVRPTATPSTTITVNDLTAEGEVFKLDESSAASMVALETLSFSMTDERTDDTAIDSMIAAKIRTEILPDDPITVFGEREITYTIPGAIRGLVAGTQANPGTLDLWAAANYTVLFDWQGRGQITGEVPVLRGVVDEQVGDEIVVNLVHNPTASASQTPKSQRGTVSRRCQILRRTEHPEGPTLLLLDRGKAADDIPGGDLSFPECDDIGAPVGLAVSLDGTVATLTWSNGDITLPVEVSITEGGELVVIQVMPPGSTSFVFTLPNASTEYTFAVRHVDAPPLHCTSDYATTTGTTGATDTLDPPIDPAAWSNGAGTYGMDVTATEIPSGTNVWEAVETGVGTGIPDTFVEVGTVASVADGRTRYTSPNLAPNDGKLRYLEARHTRSGLEPSVFTGIVSVNPWATTVPPDPVEPPPVETAVTSVPIEVPLLLTTRRWEGEDLVEDAVDLGADRQEIVDLGPFGVAWITATIRQSSVPDGCRVAIKYIELDGAEWLPLDSVTGGPFLVVDTDTVAEWPDGVMRGLPVPIDLAARKEVRLGAFVCGGDGSGTLVPGRLAVWFNAAPINPDPAEHTDDDETEEVPCDTGSIDFDEFDSWAEVQAAGWSAEVSGNISMPDPEIIPDPNGGGFNVLHLSVGCSAANPAGAVARIKRTVTGLDTKGDFVTGEIEVMLVTPSFGVDGSSFGVTGTGSFGWGIGPQGSGHFLNPQDYEVQTLSPAVTAASHTIHAGTVVAQNGDQFHSYHAYIKRITLTLDVPCTETVPGGSVGEPGQPGPQPPPPPVPPTVPPPVPVTGDAPFGYSDQSPFGLANMNSFIYKATRVSDLAGVLGQARALDYKLVMMPQGSQGLWMTSGGRVFSLDLWIQAVRRFADNADYQAAVDDGTIFANYLVDEPQKADRYGFSMPLAYLKTMAAVSRELWPNLRTFIRIRPSVYNARVPGLSGWWLSYNTRLGSVEAALAADVALSASLGCDHLAVGLNTSNSAGVGTAAMTASQILQYGMPLARSPLPGCFLNWRYDAGEYGQAGVPNALATVNQAWQDSRP